MKSSLFSGLRMAILLGLGLSLPFSPIFASSTPFPEKVSVADLHTTYQQAASGKQKFRILIVPGHEPGYGGAEFGGLYERELTVILANDLAAELRTDPRLDVLVARGNDGWNSDLAAYFEDMDPIENFVEKAKKNFLKLVDRGRVDRPAEEVAHATAQDDVALRLYGISKWAAENDVDLMVHLHMNDEGSHRANVAGTQSGFAIYVPDHQYGNADASKAIATPIFARLSAISATSTMPLEDAGIVEDQSLIALGAYNTSSVPSILIEYGYLYESKFAHPEVLPAILEDYSYETALGLEDFLGEKSVAPFISRTLPATWTADAIPAANTKKLSSSVSIYALQAALHQAGAYPAGGKTFTDCPLSGTFGPCTLDALKAFQAKNALAQTGTLGPQTRALLNKRFGAAPVIATGGTCGAFAHILSSGSTDAATGGEVTKLQKILAQDPSIYPSGSVSGFFGPATLAGVKAFQEEKGIAKAGSTGYGQVGPVTGKALSASCSAKS